MPAAPFFTVIVPTKGRPTLLARALRSALVQRDAAFDVLVADDGEGEGEAVALALGDPRVAAFRTGARGQVPARNLSVARAEGHAIAFLDDDDWWADADHLARMAHALRAGAGFAFADGRIVHEDEGGAEEFFAAAVDAKTVRRDNLLLVSGIAFTRCLWERVGPFDESLPVYWDWDFYLRLADAGTTFARSGGDGVRISVRAGTASAAEHGAARQGELDRLCVKHGLEGIRLRNHASIARDQAVSGDGSPG